MRVIDCRGHDRPQPRGSRPPEHQPGIETHPASYRIDKITNLAWVDPIVPKRAWCACLAYQYMFVGVRRSQAHDFHEEPRKGWCARARRDGVWVCVSVQFSLRCSVPHLQRRVVGNHNRVGDGDPEEGHPQLPSTPELFSERLVCH